jgi:hypothetical protein
MAIQEYAEGEIVRIGKDIYERDLRKTLDTPENRSRLVALDIKTGEYEMGRDSLEVIDAMLARRPDAVIYLLRIGRPTAHAIGGWR